MTQGARGKMCVMESTVNFSLCLCQFRLPCKCLVYSKYPKMGRKMSQINRTVQMAEVKQKKKTLLFLMMRVALFEDTFDHGLSVTITRK